MAAKRLLDAAALFNAVNGVAKKHFLLRSSQLDVYTKTSTIAKAVKYQTDRVTETAKAASALAARLNEDRKSSASRAHEAYSQTQSRAGKSTQHVPDENAPGRNSEAPSSSDQGVEEEALKPKSSDASTIPDPANYGTESESARALQRQAEQQIPSRTVDGEGEATTSDFSRGIDKDSYYEPSTHRSSSYSSLPRTKIPKHSENTQGDVENLPKSQINSDSFYSSAGKQDDVVSPQVQAIQEQDQIPDDVNTELFHSPRIAKLLGGKTQRSKPGNLTLKAATSTPVEQTPLAKDKDQDTFNVRTSSSTVASTPKPSSKIPEHAPQSTEPEVEELAQDLRDAATDPSALEEATSSTQTKRYQMRESAVPSSRFGRLWNYGGLAAGMLGGAVGESFRRVTGSGGQGSYMLSAGNMDRLVSKLSRMRGAALKLGQMMSFQDSKMLPGPLHEVLQRVQDSADYMPSYQRDKVLAANLGEDWRDIFEEFEDQPIAAASIGQVHRAILKSSGQRVAVKVQYPGVASSIDSDLSNLAILLTASRLLPKGLYLDKTIANARTELAWECDYVREAESGKRFEKLLADEQDVFTVPKIYTEISGKEVLVMEYMDGVGVTRVQNFTQEQKDWIGTQILRLCLREITEFRFMQTDPNWTNFLYNASSNRLELLDFGASREYPEEFISRYTRLLLAASRTDKDTVRDLSIELGYLTGHESRTMLDAHISSVLTLAEPFLASSPEVYDFRDQTITERVKGLIPVMIRERLAPPPEETYSLHRKLSGAFLLCAKLGSRVRCRDLFEGSMKKAGLV